MSRTKVSHPNEVPPITHLMIREFTEKIKQFEDKRVLETVFPLLN